MNIFIAGLRRSGTTILFDILEEDSKINSFYEPLCAGKKTIGGGSGEKKVDLNQKIRQYRSLYLKKNKLDLNPLHFNYGAPKDFSLELSSKNFDEHLKNYISHLINSSDITLLKFVRVTFLIDQLYEISPDSFLIHTYKNPLRFATSHIFGIRFHRQTLKGKAIQLIKNVSPYHKLNFEKTDPDYFFNMTNGFNSWSQESLVHQYLKDTNREELIRKPAYFKLMLLWKEWNQKMVADGKDKFKERFISVEHESLSKNPERKLCELSDFLGFKFDPKLYEWAKSNLKAPRPIFAKNDSRWQKALEELEIDSSFFQN